VPLLLFVFMLAMQNNGVRNLSCETSNKI